MQCFCKYSGNILPSHPFAMDDVISTLGRASHLFLSRRQIDNLQNECESIVDVDLRQGSM